jgi:glc operon protein GlcG
VVRTLLTLGVVLLAVGGSGRAQAPLPTKRVLTLEAARRVAAAAESEARKNNWAVSIAVLDDSGHMVLFQRMDGAKLVATDIAVRKARTAVYFQGPTKDLEAEVAGGRTALLPIEGFMPLEGGVPLMSGGQLVGAVGVSGVTGAQDAQCALAGAAVVK